MVSIYIANSQIEIDDDVANYSDLRDKSNTESSKNSEQICQRLKQDYPDLNVSEKDFRVIPGGLMR